MSLPISELLRRQRLIICVGSGGVGKTTVAASLAVTAARSGRKTLVLTIDPARRLANALGLKAVGNDEVRIPLDSLSEGVSPPHVPGSGRSPGAGELWAMMLDSRHAFDALIRRIARDPERQRIILENNVYRNIADSIAGSQEYMATEKLYDVVASGRYDLVVLDTPPVKNALDFLEAPGRLARFLDKRIMRWFLEPYDERKVFGRFMMGTSAVVFRLLGHIFGREFLADIHDFFHHFRDLYDGFRERHEAVLKLFHAPETSFVVVCAPNEPSVEVATYFLDEFRTRRLPGVGVIVNQVHPTSPTPIDPEAALGALAAARAQDLQPHTDARLLARLGAAHRRLRELSALEEQQIALVTSRLGAGQRIWRVPRLETQVHDLSALGAVGDLLMRG